MRRSPFLTAVAASAAFLLAGCAGSPDADPTLTETATAPVVNVSGELTVYAAASLRAAFDEIATAFEEANPSVTVEPIVYDGSSTLATQIIEGAPADVFASADEANMTKVSDADLADESDLFATNTLVIAVPADNPGGVEDLADLATVITVLCAPEVPCGAASQTLLEAEGVAVTPASLEQNVTAVLTKVQTGEADAGLVYATDVLGDDLVDSIVPAGAEDVVNRYPVAALSDAANPEAAAAFVAFVLSDEGQQILADLGFGAP